MEIVFVRLVVFALLNYLTSMHRGNIESGRTKFSSGIVAEFWKPNRESQKALIICDGAPGLHSKRDLGEFFARKGYWAFQFRYRGTWESEGEFLRQSPARDVDDVIHGIQKKFREAWTGATYHPSIKEMLILGVSFGGAAAILASQNSLVMKVIAIAPVVDWNKSTKEEPFSEFIRQIKDGYPGAYRCPKNNLYKLRTKNFYNPVDSVLTLDGKKIFLMCARDDHSVPYLPTKKLAQKIGATYVERARGGHLSGMIVTHPIIWKRIHKFLK